MTDTASITDEPESFRLVASFGKTYRYGKKEIELAKDLATLMPDGYQPTQKEVRELLDRSKEWLKSQEKATNKLLNEAARSMGVCPVPVKGEPGVKFTDAHIRRASTIAFYSNMPPKTQQEAEGLLVMAAAGVQAYAYYAAGGRVPDSVTYAVIRRYNSAARAPGTVTHPRDVLQWLREEEEFQKDPFTYTFTQLGADIEFIPPAAGSGEIPLQLQKLRSAAMAMVELSSGNDFRMPPELMHLSRLEQARALYTIPGYSRLLKAVPELPQVVVLPPDAQPDAAGPQPGGEMAAQAAPLGPEDTGTHAIPLGKGRKKAGPEAPEAPAENTGGELDIDVDVETPQAAPAAPQPAHAAPQPPVAAPMPPAENPEFLRAKKLIGEAADEFRRARDNRLREEEAQAIKSAFPALMGMARKSLSVAMGREVSADEATELIVDGPKSNGGEGQRTGRKGLLELFEGYIPTAVQSVQLLEMSVKREKAKMDAGRTNLDPTKKAELDAWLMVLQMPSVMAEVNKRFGASNKAQRTDMDSAVAHEDAIKYVRGHAGEVETPEQAMELFTRLRWKQQIEKQVRHRAKDGLVPLYLENNLQAAILQDETLKAQKGFADVDAEIAWHVSFFLRNDPDGYPAKLVAHLRHKQGVLTPKVYDDVAKRLDAENPLIRNEADLTAFIRKSWKIYAVERVSSLVSNGLLSSPAGERALKSMMEDKELAEKGFSNPGEELRRYVEACRALNEPFPAKLALFIKRERGSITQEVEGAALLRIIEEKLVFKDGDEFGRFVEKVREHMTAEDLANDRKRYVPGVFSNTGRFGAVSGDLGLLAEPMGKGMAPHPAPPHISVPPIVPAAIGALVVPGAAGSTSPHPAADAEDGGKTTTMRSPAAPIIPAAPPAVGAPEGAATKPEAAAVAAAAEARPGAAPAPAAASAEPAQAAPQPPVAAPMAPAGIPLPSRPPAVPPMDAWRTTTMEAPKLGAAAAPPPAPHGEIPLEKARTITLEAASVPAAAVVPPERRNTDLTPIPAEIIAASASAAPTPGEALPPSFVRDLSPPGPAAEASEGPGIPSIGGAGAASATEAATDEDVVEEATEASSATILSPPPDELVAQAAEDAGGTDEPGERPTLFSDTPQELLDASAEPAAEPGTATAPNEAGKASVEDAYVARLSATLFAEKPLKARVAAALMLVEEPPEVHVPILLRAYCQQPDMQPKVISILSERPVLDVLGQAFAYRDSLLKDGVLDRPLHELAGQFKESALQVLLEYIGWHGNAGTLDGNDVALVLGMAQEGGIADSSLSQALSRVPPMLDAYCRHPGMQSRVIALLAEKPASEVLTAAFAYRDALAKDGVLDPALTALAERYGKAPGEQAGEDGVLAARLNNPLPAMLDYVAKHRDAGTLTGADVSLVLEMARSGGISAPALVSTLLPAFDRLDKGTREGIRTWITGKWNPMKKDALPPILSHMDVSPGISPESAIMLAKAAREAAGDDAAPVLARLFPVMARMDQEQKTSVGLLAEKFGTHAVDYALSYAASGDMGVESVAILSRALESIEDKRARGFLEHALPLFEHMNEEQQARVIGFATKYDCSDIVLRHADGLAGRLTMGQALMFAKLLLKIREGRGGTGERGKEFLAHMLPLFEHMDEEQQARATEFATTYDCSDIILKHAAGLNGKLTIGQALLLANLLLRIKESRGTDDGVAFMPYLLRFAEGMDAAEKEYAREYAARFREGAEKGKDSVTSIRSFVAARGAAITEKEMALVASSLVRIRTNESYKALGEILLDKNLPSVGAPKIHDTAEAELAAEYVHGGAAGEAARDFMHRAALREKGGLAALGTIAFNVIGQKEDPSSPAQEVIAGCIGQHLATEVEAPDNQERLGKARELLVRFGDKAIGQLSEVALSPDFSKYPEMHRMNVLTTVAHIAEGSSSEATKQKARECLMEAVNYRDLSPATIGSAMNRMRTNMIAAMRERLSRNPSVEFERRVCEILGAMGETAQAQILEALSSRDPAERFAGATMQGLMLMHDPELAKGLAADSRKPEKDRAFPTLHSVLRTLVHMLRDKEREGPAEQVAVAAYGALSAAGSALRAEDLANVIKSGVPGGPKEALPPHQDDWSRAAAANLLVRAEGGESTLLAMLPDRSLAPEARGHVIEAAMEFGGSALPAIVEWARGGGIEEKYVALSAANKPTSPLAELLKDIEQGVTESPSVLQQFGIVSPAEPWQQDLLRWAAVRGLVRPMDPQMPVFVAAIAGKLACTLGVVSQSEFCGDLRAALDAYAKREGQLPEDAEKKKMFLLGKLAENGFGIDHIIGAFGDPDKDRFLSEKYSAFIRSMKAKQSQQPPAPAGKDGSGARKLPK